MKYLVTGTGGFIAGNMKERLVELGHNVIPLDKEIFSNDSWKTKLETLFKDFKFDGVFHIGACSDTLSNDANKMMLLNYEFTKSLCDLCSHHKIKIVYSSSVANYGITGIPSNLYGWSKYAAENYLMASRKGVNLRYCNVFGPGEERKGKMASIGFQAFQQFHVNKTLDSFPLFPGRPLRDFIYVDDVVSANLYAMNMVQEGTVWDVGTGGNCSFEEILDIFEIPYHHRPPEDVPVGYQFVTKTDKKKWMPGWKPTYEIREAFSKYKEILFEKYNIVIDK